MSHLICYDIANNSLRNSLGTKILQYGFDRINKSVYLGTVSDTLRQELEQWLAQKVQQQGEPDDSIILLPLTPAQVQRMRIYGADTWDKDELSGDKHTLII